MKKDLIFSPVLLAIGAALFLFRLTGVAVHIAISVVGLALLIVYTVLTKKDWRIPALEIIMRLCYAIALITGIVIMNVEGILALAIAHKVGALLYMVLMIILPVNKLVASKKA